MDPKSKAEELFNKMKGFRVKHSHSKKCVKVLIEEILSLGYSRPFYEEVLLELEKL